MKKSKLCLLFSLIGLFFFSSSFVQADNSVDVFRLYNPNTGEHFYTTSTQERTNLMGLNWQYEGVGWTAPSGSGEPVYRLYNPNAKGGDHHYTISSYERDDLKRKGWHYDGVFFNSGGAVDVHVAYNPNAESGAHNFTTNKHEQNDLLSKKWQHGKVAFKAVGVGKTIVPPMIYSQVYVVATPDGRVSAGKNQDKKMYVASVSKLVILARIQEAVQSGKLKWSQTFTADPSLAGKNMWGTLTFKAGKAYTLADYYWATLMASSNPAAIQLGIILDGSNASALKNSRDWLTSIGIKNPTFVSLSGLETVDLDQFGLADKSATGNLFTANELLTVLKYINAKAPAIFADAKKATGNVAGWTIENISTYAYTASITSGKTGYTELANYCFAGKTSDGRYIIMLGAPNFTRLNSDSKLLLQN